MPDFDTPIPVLSGRTLVYQGLAQTDLDMANHKLLNLDDSNLSFGSAPPTIGPVVHQWLKSWNSTTRVWGISQPDFSDLSGSLTSDQQLAITQVGTITSGLWRGGQVEQNYVPRLERIRPPLGGVDMNQHKILNLADPSDPQDAVNLRYVNSILPGIQVKEAVQAASNNNIVLHGLRTVDDFPVQDTQRVLVKSQTDQTKNGIWICNAGADWNRALDSNMTDELLGAYCFVLHGTQNGNTAWVQNNDLPDGLGTSPVHYVLFTTGGVGPPGPPGVGVPSGGFTGSVLTKLSTADYDTAWVIEAEPLGAVPIGGLTGQILVKHSNSNYDTVWDWALPPGGLDFEFLAKSTTGPYGSEWVNLVPLLVPPDSLGTNGQFLKHDDTATYGGTWADVRQVPPTSVPGYTAQVGDLLIKDSIADTGYRWVTSPSQVPAGGAAYGSSPGDVLTFIGPDPWDNSWETPSPAGGVYAILQTTQLNPTGTTNTTGVMMGLNKVITPLVTGKLIVTIAGFMYNNGAGSAGAGIRIGTGTPPVNGAPPAGTGYGAAAICGPLGANVRTPFSVTAAISGLTVGTQIWIDLDVLAISPGTASVAAVTISAWEIP